ncbi:hypothetical protein OG203_36080 [Nocardia sp. NBC_01499]|uniref:hypothetical protein n=1 Tax=Nocardia sp. NBC_01499 TaxID=2903597 RepID=UPI00386388CB
MIPPPPEEVVPPPPVRLPDVVVPPRNPVRVPVVVPPAPQVLPPAPPQLLPAALELTPSTVGPGAGVTASGHGCDPRAPVDVAIGGVAAGKTVAGVDGAFEVPLVTGAVDVGRYQVTATCGRTLVAPLDVVLVSSIGAGTSTLTVILFILLLGGWYYGRRLVSQLPERRGE